MRFSLLLIPALFACAAAPTTEPVEPEAPLSYEPRPPAEPTPWTEAFFQSAVLMADTIRVEGPPGLFEHAALRSDDEWFQTRTKTTTEGLLHSVRRRGSAPDMQPARAQLDAWDLAGLSEVVLLERFQLDAPVIVTARGNAVYVDTNGNRQEGSELVFEGIVEAAAPR